MARMCASIVRTKRLAWFAVTSLLLLTLFAFWQRNEAERQRKVAVARQLAAQAEVTRNQRRICLQRSVLLAVESMQRFPSLEADQPLRQGISFSSKLMTIVRAHEGGVTAVSFSPDGRYVATGSWDKTARVWEVSSGREVARLTHGDYVYGRQLQRRRALSSHGQSG